MVRMLVSTILSGAVLCAVAVAGPASPSGAQDDAPKGDRTQDAQPQDAQPQDAQPQDGGSAARERAQDGRGARERRGDRLPPDWPRAGGFGAGDRPMIEGLVAGDFGRRALTDEDLAKAVDVAKLVSAEWGAAIAERAKSDPEGMKAALRGNARRLLALVALRERAPLVFEAKVAEIRAQAEVQRVAGELREARGAGADAARIDGLSKALDAASAAQVRATLVARRAEVEALESQLSRLRAEIEADAARAAELEREVRARAENPPRERGDAAREPRGDAPPRGDAEPRGDAPAPKP